MRGPTSRWAPIFLLLTGLAIGLAARPASADEDATVDRTGPYLELSGVGAGSLDEKDVGGGFRFQTGYRVHPLFGAEAEVEFVDDLEGGPTNDKVDVWWVGGNAKLFLPPWQNGQLYALAGAGVIGSVVENQTDEQEFAARFGGGFEVLLTRGLFATLEVVYVMPRGGDIEDLDYVAAAVGLQYRF